MISIYDHHDRDPEPGRDRDIGPRRSLDMGLGRDRHWDMGPGHLRIPSIVNSHARLQWFFCDEYSVRRDSQGPWAALVHR